MEGTTHQAMNQLVRAPFAFTPTKANHEITMASDPCRKQPWWNTSQVRLLPANSRHNATKAFHTSMTTDLVKTFPPHYRSPLLHYMS